MTTIYTLGHSTKSFEDFNQELEEVGYDYVIDVRSRPYSRYVPQYNKNRLIAYFREKYIWMWESLWWMDDDISFEVLQAWLQRVSDLAKNDTVVLFCSERDFKKCHRYFTITPELEIRGFKVIHL